MRLAALRFRRRSKHKTAQACVHATGLNTGVGTNALSSVNPAIGINNTAVGFGALKDNTDGFYNTAVGPRALEHNTTGQFNMAIGTEALNLNNANFNLAIGFRVGFLNTTGNHLTGIGAAAMRNNTTGGFNTAIGSDALRENTTTSLNVAVGDAALAVINDGGLGANTALGSIALTALTTGDENVAVGERANSSPMAATTLLWGGALAMALLRAMAIPFSATAGRDEGPDVDNVICVGTQGDPKRRGRLPPNRCFIGHIRGVTTGGPNPAIPVLIDEDGRALRHD